MSRRVAVVGAVLFALGGTFIWTANPSTLAAPFLPVVLLGIERAGRFAAAGRPGGGAWITCGIAWSLYAGMPEVAYVFILLAAIVWIRHAGNIRRLLAGTESRIGQA